MRVLVTGGAGFIGSHVIDALRAAGHTPAALDDLSSGSRANLPSDVPLHVADVRDAERVAQIFDEVRPEAVCHQAAQLSVSYSVREPAFDADVNLIGLLRILANSARVGVKRVVFASSGGVLYGDVSEPTPEEYPANPISPYGISKWASELYLQFYAREYNLPSIALRYSNVYGPRQNPHGEAGVVAIFNQKLFGGQQATIFGDGLNVRDYVYVGDVARANLLALESQTAEPFVALNIGTGKPTDVNELARQLRELVIETRQRAGLSGEVPELVHAGPRAGDLRSSLISARRAEAVLGWKPQVTISDGLRKTVDWFATQLLGKD